MIELESALTEFAILCFSKKLNIDKINSKCLFDFVTTTTSSHSPSRRPYDLSKVTIVNHRQLRDITMSGSTPLKIN